MSLHWRQNISTWRLQESLEKQDIIRALRCVCLGIVSKWCHHHHRCSTSLAQQMTTAHTSSSETGVPESSEVAPIAPSSASTLLLNTPGEQLLSGLMHRNRITGRNYCATWANMNIHDIKRSAMRAPNTKRCLRSKLSREFLRTLDVNNWFLFLFQFQLWKQKQTKWVLFSFICIKWARSQGAIGDKKERPSLNRGVCGALVMQMSSL